MVKKDRELLLKDLCARLPYRTVVYYCNTSHTLYTNNFILNERLLLEFRTPDRCVELRPYLRSMSSMTEEELFDLCEFAEHEDWEGKITEMYCIVIAERYDPIHSYDKSFNLWGVNMKAIDWLNAHHFDYRGLIEKGLAIEVTKENNPYENNNSEKI